MQSQLTPPPGKLIRSWRVGRNWSQQRLADFTGISQKKISDIERGRVDVKLRDFVQIANALGYQPLKDYFIEG